MVSGQPPARPRDALRLAADPRVWEVEAAPCALESLVRVKICGITRLTDAELAADLGAAMVGFVFWPGSPRFIDPYRALRIVPALPPWVSPVGVFVDQPIDYVRGVANLVKLGAVQLHGHAPAGSYRQLPYRVIQAVRMAGDRPLDAVGQLPRHVTVLLDAYDPVRVGGTGRTVDWQAAAAIAEDRRIILSGGLRAENVTEAIETVCPFGVDVASGVEERPGVKDPARLKSFFQAVRQATKGQG